MGLLDRLFGKQKAPVRSARSKPSEPKKIAKQVYEGRPCELPEWAARLDQSHLVDECIQHSVCKFTPHIEVKKIMTTRTGLDGNLEAEYEGIAVDCGATRTYGKQVAQRDGYMQPYRYADLNHILACCCDKPRKCVFYALATGDDKELNKRMKRVDG
ncbi:MAG: hypothetical protein JXR77_05350 [Lentisphaeria bacterium]|nr:hypothetical protein [Lentisphaeria bacterium]